jgi:hypothetical protein
MTALVRLLRAALRRTTVCVTTGSVLVGGIGASSPPAAVERTVPATGHQVSLSVDGTVTIRWEPTPGNLMRSTIRLSYDRPAPPTG